MSLATRFQQITRQLCHLIECDTAHLVLGCPEPALCHPLLNLHAATTYAVVASFGSSDATSLLQNERIRALCDTAIQTGHLQSIAQFQPSTTQNAAIQSICIVPLERPAGILGLLLLTDVHARAFCAGEHLLLSCYLPAVVQQLEQDLRRLAAVPLKCRGAIHCALLSMPPVQQQPADPDSLKHEFISMISHELRTPLSAIKGYAVLLQAYGLASRRNENTEAEISPARQQEYLDIIMQQTSHLEVLIADLLDISRIHAGRLSLHCNPLNLASVCQSVVQLLQRKVDLEHPGRYTFRCNFAPELPLVWADVHRVQQVLANLLENAVKYSPDGGSIELAVSVSHDPRMVCIAIRDSGIGISPEQQSSLFKPFSRLEHTRTAAIPGAGLGLYISSKLVEAMGGNITLCSRANEGTTVTFTLPITPSDSVSTSANAPLAALTR